MQKKGPSDIQVRTEQRQQAELSKLSAQEAQRTRAAGRRTRGRASLISGSERGMGDTGFEQKNIATQEKLGVEATEQAGIRSTAETKRRQSLLDAESLKKNRSQRFGVADPIGTFALDQYRIL